MSTAHPAPSRPRRTGRIATLLLGTAVLLGATAAPAFAKEVGSGGTPVPTTCNPVSSLSAKGDATNGEIGLASIQIDYGVKPCIKDQAVIVDVQLAEYFTPTNVFYDDPAAPLTGRVQLLGVKVNTTYSAKVTVYDAASGAVAGTKSVSVAATRRTTA